MQAITSISTSLIYLILSIGINLNLHFCEQEIKDIHLNFQTRTTLPDFCHRGELPDCCTTPEQKAGEECSDCCFFVKKFFKINEDQHKDFKKPVLADLYREVNTTVSPPVIEEKKDEFYPPLSGYSEKPLFLLNCSLLFYG